MRTGLLDHPVWTAAVGAVAGVATVAAMVALDPGPPTPPPGPTPAAAAAFLQAWRSHLLATWSVTQIEERVTTAGTTLRIAIHEAQRPPDRVRTGGAAIEARRGSTLIGCVTAGVDNHPVCRQGPATQTWAQTVDAEMSVLSRLVGGSRAVYGVTATPGGCFDLVLQRPPETVPVSLGRGSQYCIDAATGAVLRSRVQRAGAVDTVITTEHHAPAVDADLAIPAGAVFR